MSLDVLDLWRTALFTAALVGGPFLIAALAVGVVISVLQAATQIQENMLSFIPKLVAVAAILALGGPRLLDALLSLLREATELMVRIGQQGAG